MRTKGFCKVIGLCGATALIPLAVGFSPAQTNSNDLPPSPITTQSNPLSVTTTSDAGISNQPTPPMLPLQDKGALANVDPDMQVRLRMWQVYMAQEIQMVKDSRKLAALADKLNAEVTGQHGGPLTAAERKEVAEIEKLAHSVRTKMQAPIPPVPKTLLVQAGP